MPYVRAGETTVPATASSSPAIPQPRERAWRVTAYRLRGAASSTGETPSWTGVHRTSTARAPSAAYVATNDASGLVRRTVIAAATTRWMAVFAR